jgi:hypothetical protein
MQHLKVSKSMQKKKKTSKQHHHKQNTKISIDRICFKKVNFIVYELCLEPIPPPKVQQMLQEYVIVKTLLWSPLF